MPKKIDMHIGHINLARSFNGAGEHFVRLIEALREYGVTQYVVVHNVALARRLDLIDGVTAGPTVRSAVMAYVLMPHVDVVHVHRQADGQAGLLLALTRSIPFVLTPHDKDLANRNPLSQAVVRRASGFVYRRDANAAKHLRVYRHAIDAWRASAVML